VKADGTAWCWGNNWAGQLGDDSTQMRRAPVRVLGLTNIVQVSAGNLHSCAVESSGGAWCWGANAEGQLGDGSTAASRVPVPVAGLTDTQVISAGGAHTCAAITNGTAYCWGANDSGEVGDGTTARRTLPTVAGLPVHAAHISAGGYYANSEPPQSRSHTCAVVTNGTAFCWGRNNRGQLGNGSTTEQFSPVQVFVIFSVFSISAGIMDHTCAVTAAGRGYCWGENNDGRLGNGTNVDSVTPVAVTDPY
jgi:alpha-tubulin suppressor-like RCC1 family protein